MSSYLVTQTQILKEMWTGPNGQIHPPRPTDSPTPNKYITTEISNVRSDKHCSHTDIYEMMNKSANVLQMENESSQMDCEKEKQRIIKEHLVEPFCTIPHCFFPFPSIHPLFLLTRIIFLFRCNLPPSSLSVFCSPFLPLCVPQWA